MKKLFTLVIMIVSVSLSAQMCTCQMIFLRMLLKVETVGEMEFRNDSVDATAISTVTNLDLSTFLLMTILVWRALPA